ncbi:ABC transporter ATP-binding protein [Marinithermus hydrothermalis]|uniref:Fe(3+)-transporting ATPase n=1 Tax=Marinithermus hydrothermalis (strain DSM 14884 / JCM 11576 / T1) TaxID=869210 RepID=F2NMT6_MARHT|nr:ABC transporter ATP-binding protein [Marinithermus hydrothermalis]AEB12470.1 Fe(3+)-transporting ATPase [Marinithermus hydrothermalis DSM 14884]
MLQVTNLTKRFGPGLPPVVEGLEFTVAPGEILALLGPSGCGKTTTLRLIAGFERADSGEVRLQGHLLTGPHTHVPPERRGIGFVFQDYALFPHLSVLGNVMFGLAHLPPRERKARALEVLDLVGVTLFKDRMPHELSGGQQQRVALARTLAPAPRLILLDEPFSNLDVALRSTTREEVRAILKASGTSAVLVTHDQEEALSFADRLAVMRSGRIEQIGTPEEVYHRPRTPFVAQFLGRTNLIPAQAEGRYAVSPLGRLELDRACRGQVLLSLRPEHLELVPANGEVSGEVIAREFKGHDLTYRVRLGDAVYLVQTDYTKRFELGARVRLVPREAAVVVGSGGPLDPEPCPF